MKKIGILLPSINAGGAERAATRIGTILSTEYEVILIVFSDQFKKYYFNGEIISLDTTFPSKFNVYAKIVNLYKRVTRLKKLKKEKKLDVVISFMDMPNLVNILSKNEDTAVITSVRNYDFMNKHMIERVVYNLILKKSDSVVAVSEYIKDKLIEEFEIPNKKIVKISNPYNISSIESESNESLGDLERIYEKNTIRFVSVGRIAYQKGFWHLIKAFKIIHDKYPNTELVIIGRDESNGYAQNLIKKLNIEDSVYILGYQKNPFKHVKVCDIYVLSSLYEGFPNSLVEAMALKKPIIATNCKTGPLEILNENIHVKFEEYFIARYGILVRDLEKEEDWDASSFTKGEYALAAAMEKLINDRELNDMLSKKAYQRASYYNYDNCKNNYMEQINRLINEYDE